MYLFNGAERQADTDTGLPLSAVPKMIFFIISLLNNSHPFCLPFYFPPHEVYNDLYRASATGISPLKLVETR